VVEFRRRLVGTPPSPLTFHHREVVVIAKGKNDIFMPS